MRIKKFAMAACAVVALAFGATSNASADGKVDMWSGAYAGINIGYGSSKFNDTTATTNLLARAKGGIGGLHGGYNWQANTLVFGVEGDYDFARLTGTADLGGGFTVESRVKSLGSIRGRLGVLVSPDLLLFGTLGYGFGQTKVIGRLANAVVEFSATTRGFGLGGGLDYKIQKNISLRGDLTHYFAKANFDAGGGSTASVDTPTTVIRTGLTYHFN